MSAVKKTVPVDKPANDPACPLWPPTRKRLLVTFETVGMSVTALGEDPDNNNEFVFTAELDADQQEAFIQAVSGGGKPDVVSNDTVVIPGTGDDGGGPKFQLKLVPSV